MKVVVKTDEKIIDLLKSYGHKNYSRLQKVPIVDKNGHTRMVYKKVDEDKKSVKTVSLKEGLTETSEIAEYLRNTISKMGYNISDHHSNLSDSEYITIENAGHLFGKDETDSIEIRIATHNLPPSYDKQYQGDFDIRSGTDKYRIGANGDAMNYDDLLALLAKKKGFSIPEYENKKAKEKLEREQQIQRNLQYYQNEREKADNRVKAMDYIKNKMPEKYKEVQDLYAKADTVTGDKRKQLRKQANKILNEIAEKYL